MQIDTHNIDINDLVTIYDLKQALKSISSQKNLKTAGKVGTALLKIIPGLGTGVQLLNAAQDLGDVFTPLISRMNIPDAAKKYHFKGRSPLEKFLHIDPQLSQILQDAVQKEFLKYLKQYIDNLKDEDDIPDLSDLLRNFINNSYLSKGKESKLNKYTESINRIDAIIQKLQQKAEVTDIHGSNLEQEYDNIIIEKSSYFMIYKKPLKRLTTNPTKLSQFMAFLSNKILNNTELNVKDSVEQSTKLKMRTQLQK